MPFWRSTTVLLLLAVLPVFEVGNYYLNLVPLEELEQRGIHTTGRMIGWTDKNRQIVVEYVVEGRTYRAQGTAPSDEARVEGAAVPIYYLPEDPAAGCVGSPKDIYQRQVLAGIAGAFGLLFLAFLLSAFVYDPRINKYVMRNFRH